MILLNVVSQQVQAGRRVVVDTSSRRWREQYRALTAGARDASHQSFQRLSLDAIEITTGQPYVGELTRFFRLRGRKR